METLVTADGRTLAYEVVGDPDGTPVFWQHGTGDSRLCKHPDDAATAALGVKLVTADRPGVGCSSPKKPRRILDWVADAEAIADAAGLERFVVAGHSGGGPHAMAIATTLGDRVTKVGLAASIAPFDHGVDKRMVRDEDLKLIFELAHVKWVASAAGKVESKYYEKHLPRFVAHCAKEWPADHDVFTDPVLEPMFEAEFGAAFAQGGVGALDDMWGFLDWGFAPEDVAQPVEMFVGDADDVLDPEMSAQLAQRLPNATLHTWSGAGHYGVYARWQEFLSSIL
jgi:pimeloyl-ACP methyl ester carboxylesterase